MPFLPSCYYLDNLSQDNVFGLGQVDSMFLSVAYNMCQRLDQPVSRDLVIVADLGNNTEL